MKLLKSKKILFLLIIILILIVVLKTANLRSYAFKYLPDSAKIIIKVLLKEIDIKSALNDYNIVFLPETQEVLLDIKKIKLNFLNENKEESIHTWQSFYFDFYDKDNIIISYIDGTFYIFDKSLINENDQLNLENVINIKSNLNVSRILDSFTTEKEDKIYVSYITKDENCYYLNLSSAKKNLNRLAFDLIFKTNECTKQILGGRIQRYELDNIEGLLLTTSDTIPDKPTNNSQNNDSFFGKILFIDEKKKDVKVFSLGHRNPQGLLVDNQLILSTEHGPRGGDEINKIILGKNYGWPISSYGTFYSNEDIENPFEENHYSLGYEEPIYSFTPSIGISEIIKINNNFSKYWKDNFLVSSLRDQSLYRVKFDKDFKKIIFMEKIFVNSKIRDLKYDYNNQSILLALEGNDSQNIMRLKLSKDRLFKKQFNLYQK
jgi:hypothetical protein